MRARAGQRPAVLEAAARWLALVAAVAGKEMTVLTRYPLELVATFAQVFLMVGVFTLAGLMFAPGGRAGAPAKGVLSGTMVYGFVVFIFFVEMMWTVGYSLRREQKQGTLEQLYVSPAPTSAGLVARVLVVAAWTGVLAVVSVALMATMTRALPLHHLGAATLLLVCIVSGIVGLGFAFAALALRLGETAQVIATLAQFLMMTLCAPFFPFAVLPRWLLPAARALPLAHAVDLLRATLMGFPAGYPELAPPAVGLAVVVAFGVVMPAAGVHLYARAEAWARRVGRLSDY